MAILADPFWVPCGADQLGRGLYPLSEATDLWPFPGNGDAPPTWNRPIAARIKQSAQMLMVLLISQRAGKRFDHFHHDRPAGYRIVTIDVCPELGRRLAHDGLRHKNESLVRKAVRKSRLLDGCLEGIGLYRSGGDSVLDFQHQTIAGDRRRAGTSMADGDDRGVAFLFQFPDQRIIVLGVIAGLPRACVH